MACNGLISDVQIENVYKDDKFVTTNRVSSQCIDANTKKNLVEIFDKDTMNMLQRPIARTYFREKELYSDKTSTGKVVKHEYFILKDEFQGKKIVSNIHPKEMDSYRVNGFLEIQLDAAWDGLVVWKTMFYQFANVRDENFIKIAIQRYLREVKSMTIEEIGKAIKSDPFSVNPSHLKDASNSNNDFRHWVNRIMNQQIVLRMYKEVA